MNQQNIPKSSNSIPVPDLPVKRKRGRPRKDENIPKKENTQMPLPVPPPSIGGNIHQINKLNPIPNTNKVDTSVVGQVISGIIEGTFDGGYLVAIQAGPNDTVLRGVVFQQGHFAPVTPANDIAPHVKMYKRSEFPIPGYNPNTQAVQCAKQPVQLENQAMASMVAHQVVAMELQNYQHAPVTVPNPINMPKDDSGVSLGGNSTSLGNLTMVEQDDVMQVFAKSQLSTKDNMVIESAGPDRRVEILRDGNNEIIDHGPKTQSQSFKFEILGPESHVGPELKVGGLANDPNLSPNVGAIFVVPQALGSGPNQSELDLHNEMKPDAETQPKLNESVQHESKSENPELVPPEAIVAPMDVLLANVLNKDETCYTEKLVSPAENDVKGTTSTTGFVASKPELLAGEFAETQIFTSASQARNVDFVPEDAVHPLQSDCSPSKITESENK